MLCFLQRHDSSHTNWTECTVTFYQTPAQRRGTFVSVLPHHAVPKAAYGLQYKLLYTVMQIHRAKTQYVLISKWSKSQAHIMVIVTITSFCNHLKYMQIASMFCCVIVCVFTDGASEALCKRMWQGKRVLWGVTDQRVQCRRLNLLYSFVMLCQVSKWPTASVLDG